MSPMRSPRGVKTKKTNILRGAPDPEVLGARDDRAAPVLLVQLGALY